MSAIAAVALDAPDEKLTRETASLLSSMQHRGADSFSVQSVQGCALGVTRFAWEEALAGRARVLETAAALVVADASLYYIDQLQHELAARGASCESVDPTALIAAAYDAWGSNCVEHLDGDFAFILYDRRRRVVVMARDFVGRRAVHYHASASLLVASTTARAVGCHPLVQARLNLGTVVAAVAGLLGGSRETGFEGVTPVDAGTVVEWRPGRGARTVWRWQAPAARIGGKATLSESALELRSLIGRATTERMQGGNSGVIWLSGGADSSAIFAATMEEFRSGANAGSLKPVTVSYPEGDSAREDHYVSAMADHWNVPVTWIQSESVPLFESLEANAAIRDDPFAHTFEKINRTLAGTTVSLGSRVALDGYGGDQLFGLSEVYLADLFARLRWRELASELKLLGYTGSRAFILRSIVPWIPRRLFERIQNARGRTTEHQRIQNLPPWLTAEWVTDSRARSRLSPEPFRRFMESPSAYEFRWHLETPYFPRAVSWARALALESGVEVRSPLLDRRIIEFASKCPIGEKSRGGESKIVLREAVRGLIPDWVTAHRTTKTGIPRGYLHRQYATGLPQALEEIFGSGRRSRLEEMGIIDRTALIDASKRYQTNSEHIPGVQLYLTLQAELWLRSLSPEG